MHEVSLSDVYLIVGIRTTPTNSTCDGNQFKSLVKLKNGTRNCDAYLKISHRIKQCDFMLYS